MSYWTMSCPIIQVNCHHKIENIPIPSNSPMKLGVLFSGGKDSCYACLKAKEHGELVCLITLDSKNPESYMFHTPNIGQASKQAWAMGLPIVLQATEGVKEEELADLKEAIRRAMEGHGIEGVVTGTVLSVYQATRVQRICNELDVWCFNPLWQADPLEYLEDFIGSGLRAMITGVYAYPMEETWLGRELDEGALEDLLDLARDHRISIIGEGGEFETFVYEGPLFEKRLTFRSIGMEYHNYSGQLTLDAEVVDR